MSFCFLSFCLLVYLTGLGVEFKTLHIVDEYYTTERHPQPKYGLSKGQFQVIAFVCSIGSGLMVVGGNRSTLLKKLLSK